jgi:hypothetical protein
MANGWLAGLGKVLDAGVAYVQHTAFANKALNAPADLQQQLLAEYTRGLSGASFTGLKATLGMLIANETQAARKSGLQQLLRNADAARSGATQSAPAPKLMPSAPDEPGHFERDLALMSGWYETLDDAGRQRALLKHLTALAPRGHTNWVASLRQMQANIAERIRDHEAHESSAWGGSFEDRMAYGMARLRTGQRDPAHQRQLAEYQGVQRFVDQLLAASERFRIQRQDKETPAMTQPTPAARPASKLAAVKAAIQDMTRTGQYPGGADQLRKDVMALVETGEADEVVALLQSMGANDSGNKVLNIGDHYRPGTRLYDLRWPVAFELPIPFDELDRPTQFSVLFGEWTRREMEAAYTRNQGDNAGARVIYEECLARAEQIEVPELIARSHEGLASVAQKLNERSVERRHLLLAEAARAAP